jgi:hypothetical protein
MLVENNKAAGCINPLWLLLPAQRMGTISQEKLRISASIYVYSTR